MTIGFEADHALAVKGAPGTLPFKTSNGEIPAAHNAGRFERVASALDFLGVTRIEPKLAKAAVSLAELHRNDAATSLKDEALDNFGVGHEKKRDVQEVQCAVSFHLGALHETAGSSA